MTIEVTLWGTRGSVPVSGSEYRKYGGSTTCFEIGVGDAVDYDAIVVDCGSGLVDLGFHRPEHFGDALVLQTHVHWDHIQGFPFFRPLFDEDASFEFWGADRDGRSLYEVYDYQMSEPQCPISLDFLPASLDFRRIERSGHRQLGDLEITWNEMEHPSGSTAYRFELGDDTLVYSGDVEVQRGSADDLVEFAGDADLFVMDAQYLPGEYGDRKGFGHSTCEDAVEIADRADVDALVMTHHDPGHDDDTLDRKLEEARSFADGALRVENARDRARYRISEDEIERTLVD